MTADTDYTNVPQDLHDLWEFATDEERADMLLDYHRCLNRRNGVLTERQLTRQMREHEVTNCDGLLLISIAQQEAEDYLDDDIQTLFRMANMSDRECAIWKLHQLGSTQVEISNYIGVTHQYISKCLCGIRTKLAKAMIAYPYFGWYAVYMQEVRRK